MNLLLKIVVVLVFLSADLTGCQFASLEEELEAIENFSAINGTIVQESPSNHPVVIALFSEELSRDRLINAKLLDSRKFRFDVPPGNYIVVAFEDINKDFHYQPDEPAGYFGNPTIIPIEAGADETVIQVTLTQDLKLTDPDKKRSRSVKPNDKKLPKLWRGRANVGEVKALGDQRFNQDIGELGMWQPLRFSMELGPGLFMLEAYDPNKTPILFVHGIGGSPRIWQKAIDSLDRQRFQPWVLSYASGLSLQANANYLFEALTQLRITHDFKELYLVAHSMGGLVSQAFINRDHASTSRYLKLFVTLATPWGGHDAAQLGIDYAPAVVPAWRDMAPGSALLTELHDRPLPDDLPYHLLFSYDGGDFITTEPGDGAVTIVSQLDDVAQRRAEKIYGFDTDHTGIVSDDGAIDLLNELFDRTYQQTGQDLKDG